MKTLWAMEVQPDSTLAKPWIDYRSARRTRREAWNAFREGTAAAWVNIEKRRRSGHIRCVRVTVEALKS